MKSCPICSFARVGTAVRCPQCQSTLTLWLNCDQYGRQAYQAGLLQLSQGDRPGAVELFTHAVILAPEEPAYSAALGRVLGQLGRYQEAEWVLQRAHDQSGSLADKAAWEKAKALANAPREPEPATPPSLPAAGLSPPIAEPVPAGPPPKPVAATDVTTT